MPNFERNNDTNESLDIGHSHLGDYKEVEAVWIVHNEMEWKYKKQRLDSGQSRSIYDMDEDQIPEFLKKLQENPHGRVLEENQIGYAIKIKDADILRIGDGNEHIVKYKDQYYRIKK